MASPTGARRAHHPADLHDLIADAINAGDLDAFLDAHDADATVRDSLRVKEVRLPG